MALLTSELRRIRHELGYTVLETGADVYVGVTAIFETVIADFLQAGATTTSSTAVSAPEVAGTFTPVDILLTSATGFAQFDRAIFDVDSRQEIATISAISGPTITVLLAKEHSGTYPVTVEGGEAIVRDLLRKITKAADQLDEAAEAAGIKKVDEIEFFGGRDGSVRLKEQYDLREYYRKELADLLGIDYLREKKRHSGSAIALY